MKTSFIFHHLFIAILFFSSSGIFAQDTCLDAIVPSAGFNQCTPEVYDISDATPTHMFCPPETTWADHWFIKTAKAEEWHHTANHPAMSILISVYESCGGAQIGDCLTDGGITTGLTVGNEYLIKLAFPPGAAGEYSYCLWETHDCDFEVFITAESEVLCEGESTQLTATVNGGVNHDFSWNEGLGTGQEKLINPSQSVWYSVTVTNPVGCLKTDSIFITVEEPYLAIAGPDQSICGLQAVQLNATANGPGFWSGGDGTFSNAIDPNSTYTPAAAEEGLSITLTWTTTDPASDVCPEISDDLIIHLNPEITVNFETTNETCFNCNNGTITALVEGGTNPYLYQWSTGDNTQQIENLTPGIYDLTVTDFMDCTFEMSLEIQEYICDDIFIDAELLNISCYGAADGVIELLITGNSTVDNFFWSSGQNSDIINQLAPGIYSVTVTDPFNCSAESSFQILEPELLIIELAPDSSYQVYGGSPPYEDPILSFEAPWLIISISDQNGCTASDSLLVSSVNEKNIAPIKVFPNPFIDQLFIESTNTNELENFQLFSIDGKLIQTLYKGENQIILDFPAGLYLLEVKNTKGAFRHPIIKLN